MNAESQKLIELTEYVPEYLDSSEISEEECEMIWQNYKSKISIEVPSFKNKRRWALTSLGWVGHIPLSPEMALVLNPKVPIENIFGMLEYAYRLKGFKILEGLTNCDSLDRLYESLAKVLALRVLDRGRKGFYRAYLPESGRLPYVRGRLDVRRTCLRPWDISPECHYEEHTPDVEENQILAWTLQRILRSGMCTERSLPQVRRAYRALHGLAMPTPCSPQECVGRLYNRLNQDYQPMHALCRFFLEQSGPSHRVGEKTMLPFLVDMAHLYELFVAEWLVSHKSLLPPGFSIKPHEKVVIGEGNRIRFDIDLVLYEGEKASCVLDTKYKAPALKKPDLNQIVTYAVTKECREAILIYPKPQEAPLDETIGKIRVRSLTFSLDGDLDRAGRSFLEDLFSKGAASSVRGDVGGGPKAPLGRPDGVGGKQCPSFLS